MWGCPLAKTNHSASPSTLPAPVGAPHLHASSLGSTEQSWAQLEAVGHVLSSTNGGI